MYKVLKRDGKITDFNLSKISDAIKMAFEAQERQFHPSVIDFLALKVTADFEPKIKDGLIAVEDIQDSVENVLVQGGYGDVAKAYILYRRQREKMRNMKSTILDYKDIVDSYVKNIDWRVKENSTVTYSVGGLILSNSGAITANYWLSEIYDEEIANAHRNADLHIHDLSSAELCFHQVCYSTLKFVHDIRARTARVKSSFETLEVFVKSVVSIFIDCEAASADSYVDCLFHCTSSN